MQASVALFRRELLPIADDEDDDEQQGENPGEVEAQELRELRAGAGIGFSGEVLPAPAVAARAEEAEEKAAKRQKGVGDDEVLAVEHAADGIIIAPRVCYDSG